jgi:hypothetical protein
MLFFADSGESAVTQGMLMGAVSVVVTTLLLLLAFFDQPFDPGIGGLRPAAMERTLRIIDQELAIVGLELDLPCGNDGVER